MNVFINYYFFANDTDKIDYHTSTQYMCNAGNPVFEISHKLRIYDCVKTSVR